MNKELVRLNLSQRMAEQAERWTFAYRTTILVPNGGTTSVVLQISQDAHFDIEELTGRMVGPVDATGLFVPGAGTDFPNPVNPDVADSGLTFTMTDQGTGIVLCSDQVFAETLLVPGYADIRYQAQKWVYLLQKNATLRIDLRNRDTKAGPGGSQLYHQISMTFKGTKYR